MTNYVMCLKWGDKYPPEYVNILYHMVRRNMTIPFKFVCFTDDSTGLDSEIIAMPLIDESLRGWWGKVSYFKKPLYDLKGTALALDLDVVIVDNIDCLFQYPGDFCILKDRDHRNGNNTSVMRFNINEHSDIYDKLDLNGQEFCTGESGETLKRVRYWGDQVWITERRPNAVNFPNNWIKSYKWECIDANKKFSIPVGCKIILFHGKPDPHDVLSDVQQWWRLDEKN